MQRLNTAAALAQWRGASTGTLGLVPTMGNLHAGHLALVHAAIAACDRVVVSIFVNPLQFGPDEDLATYPRTFEADCAALEAAGAHAVFAPSVDEMVPRDGTSATTISVAGVTDMLCGTRRPGHFTGVATIVAKLFNLVRPDRAFFGEKDYQQLMVIRRMAADLCMGVEVAGVATVREADGLALSSRNQYLSTDQRRRAPALFAALNACAGRLAAGERDFRTLEAQGRAHLADAGLEPDYFEVRGMDLSLPTVETARFRVLAAAWLGRARLIDNVAAPAADGGR